MRCLNCHYSLKALTENRCPECGREFDPNEPRTFLIQEPKAFIRKRGLFALSAISYAVSYFLILPLGHANTWRIPSSLQGLGQYAFMALLSWPFVLLVVVMAWLVLQIVIMHVLRR